MKAEVRPGFKLTEAGVIPEDWSSPCLGLLVHSVEYGSSAKSSVAGKIPVLRMGNLQEGKIDWSDLVFTDDDREISKYLLKSGDVLFNRTNTPELVGKTSIYNGETPAIFAGYLIRIKEKKDLLSSVYLNYVMNSELSKKYGQSILSIAVSQANINGYKLKTYPIPLPPSLGEQQKISEALMDADALIGGLSQLIAKKHDIKQATMQQLLTGRRRLPGFSADWEIKRLEDVAQVVMGQSPSSSNYNKRGDGLPLIQGNADIIDRKTIKRIFTTEVTKFGRCGDLLLSVRAPVGEIARATFDVCLGRGVCAIRGGSEFLYHYLISIESSWGRLSKGSTFDSINSAELRSLAIRLPSSEEEQTSIAKILSDMDNELAALEARYGKARQLKQGMMQGLLTGRIRLSKSSQEAMLC
jgi:type I restriction enzyme S subunit